MAHDGEDDATALELIAQYLRATDLDHLRVALAKGEISKQAFEDEFTARFYRYYSVVQALSEQDKAMAQRITERLRDRMVEQADVLARRGTTPGKLSAASKAAKADPGGLRNRADDVLLREFVILNALAKSNAPVKSAEIFAAVRKLDAGLSDNVITAQLARMVEAGVLGKHGKGQYQPAAAGAGQIAALAAEIELRGLKLPAAQS